MSRHGVDDLDSLRIEGMSSDGWMNGIRRMDSGGTTMNYWIGRPSVPSVTRSAPQYRNIKNFATEPIRPRQRKNQHKLNRIALKVQPRLCKLSMW